MSARVSCAAMAVFFACGRDGSGRDPRPAARERGRASEPDAATLEDPPAPAQRFEVAGCGAILDHRTDRAWWVGPDRTVTWEEAAAWVAGLRLCGGGWRMPSISELSALHDPRRTAGRGFLLDGRRFPAKLDPVFRAIGNGAWVWSAETAGPLHAHSFNFYIGGDVVYARSDLTKATRAFAVRTR